MQSAISVLSRTLIIGISSFVLVLAGLLVPIVGAQTSGSGRDCDNNAVLRCGAFSTSELKQKYNSQAGAKTIFNHLGVSSTEVSQMSGTAVNGYVTKGGRVMVGDKTVATGAMTAGRQNMPGSTAVTKGGTTFYTRPPSVSFTQNKIDAYVVMKNNQFQYAVIKSCGNPVKANPVTQPKPQPAPPPPAPAPTPTPPPPAPAPAPKPSAALCRDINVTKRENRQVAVSVTSEVTNAKVTGYTIDFGDGTVAKNNEAERDNSSDSYGQTVSQTSSTSTDETDENNTGDATSSTHMEAETSTAVAHQYAQYGTYTITAYVHVRHADGKTETVTSENCRKSVTFAAPVTPSAKTEPAPQPPPPPPPAPAPAPAPAPLPDTGPGEVLGASAAVSVASMFGYALYGWLRSRFYLL